MNTGKEFKPYKVPMPNNMGMVRYVLALSVVIAHFKAFTGADAFWPVSSFTAVGGFFTLSGFLVYGSYLRTPDFKSYLSSRMRRLLPAYFTVVVFFALLLSLFSTLSATAHFSSPQFWKYLACNLCFLNFIEPCLPGVFDGLPVKAVNGSLWTMKVEWCLYLSVPLIAWLIRKMRMRQGWMFLLIYVLSALYQVLFYFLYEQSGREMYQILGRQFFGQLSYFYCGVFLYFNLKRLMAYRWQVLALTISVMLLGRYVPYYEFTIGPAAVSVLVVWLSMVGKWGTWEGKRDNVSYVVYLCHAPIIQIIAEVGLPQMIGHWWALLVAILISLAFSVIVSRFIERPFMKSRLRQ